jgi:hypothetical protein
VQPSSDPPQASDPRSHRRSVQLKVDKDYKLVTYNSDTDDAPTEEGYESDEEVRKQKRQERYDSKWHAFDHTKYIPFVVSAVRDTNDRTALIYRLVKNESIG